MRIQYQSKYKTYQSYNEEFATNETKERRFESFLKGPELIVLPTSPVNAEIISELRANPLCKRTKIIQKSTEIR